MTPLPYQKLHRAGILALGTALIFAAGHSAAEALYTAGESSIDLYGNYIAPEHGISHVFETNIRHTGAWGGGMGVTHFTSAKFGFGTDVNFSGNGGSLVDSTTLNLLGRFPLGGSGFAPYVSGGGGRAFDPATQWIGQAGVGMEYRSFHKSGFFVDARYVWGEHSSTDSLMVRFGLRMLF